MYTLFKIFCEDFVTNQKVITLMNDGFENPPVLMVGKNSYQKYVGIQNQAKIIVHLLLANYPDQRQLCSFPQLPEQFSR